MVHLLFLPTMSLSSHNRVWNYFSIFMLDLSQQHIHFPVVPTHSTPIAPNATTTRPAPPTTPPPAPAAIFYVTLVLTGDFASTLPTEKDIALFKNDTLQAVMATGVAAQEVCQISLRPGTIVVGVCLTNVRARDILQNAASSFVVHFKGHDYPVQSQQPPSSSSNTNIVIVVAGVVGGVVALVVFFVCMLKRKSSFKVCAQAHVFVLTYSLHIRSCPRRPHHQQTMPVPILTAAHQTCRITAANLRRPTRRICFFMISIW